MGRREPEIETEARFCQSIDTYVCSKTASKKKVSLHSEYCPAADNYQNRAASLKLSLMANLKVREY